MAFGITATGFNRKTEQDILSEISADFKATLGAVNDADDSLFSQVIRPFATQLGEAWEALEATYQSADVNGAEGVSLDILVGNNFITRLTAKATQVNAVIVGDTGTTVPAGNRASAQGVLFEAAADITLDPSIAMEALVSVSTVVNSTAYTVTVNGTPYAITSSGSATAANIAAALVAALAAASTVITVTDHLDGTFTLRTEDLETPFALILGTGLSLDEVGCAQVYAAVETGALACPAGQLNTIENPVTGFTRITNYLDGTLGRAAETDKELRTRRLESLALPGKSTKAAILAKLISGEVAGVTTAFVYENILDVTDSTGRPPHSVEAVVVGGALTDIASAIHAVRGAGIQTYGNVNVGAGVSIVDDQGFTQIVKFSRPVNRYAHIQVTYSLYAEEIFPTDGADQIKAAVLAFALVNFPIGKDFLLQRFIGPSMSISGVGGVQIQIAVTDNAGDTPTYGTTDIAVGDSDVLVFDSTRIHVLEAP